MERKAIWVGSENILPAKAEVTLLAFDPEDPNVEAQRACWIRYWPEGRDYPKYRSCNMSDIEILPPDASWDALVSDMIERYPVVTGYLARQLDSPSDKTVTVPLSLLRSVLDQAEGDSVTAENEYACNDIDSAKYVENRAQIDRLRHFAGINDHENRA